MGSMGDDNAVGESWFATLKEKLIDRHSWATIAQVRRAVTKFIGIFYNHEAPQLFGLPHTSRIRTADPPGSRPEGGIINLSVEPGQPQQADGRPFDRDIKPMFQGKDRDAMTGASGLFDTRDVDADAGKPA
jgi:hypothetical protein